MSVSNEHGFDGAAAVRAGMGFDPGVGHSLLTPLHQTTVQEFSTLEELVEMQDSGGRGHVYYRFGHPNATALEEAIAAIERAESCAAAASGMAAISAGIFAVCGAGDHVLVDSNAYGGTFALVTNDLVRLGITHTLFDAMDTERFIASIEPSTRLVIIEALTNPTVQVVDIPAIIEAAHAAGASVMVDATFVSPALLRPLELGADMVVHSIPKYLGGHSAAMGGVISGTQALVDAARLSITHVGGSIAPFDAWMAMLGLKTLGLRMAAHSANAAAIAHWLNDHPLVRRVDHPSLQSHPSHTRAAELLPNGTGGMLAFEVPGGEQGVSRFIKAVAGRIPFAPSLADVATTLSYPAQTSHRALGPELRAKIGVTDGLVRLSVGIEPLDTILSDLTRGLAEM